jgi:signal peptidase II
LFEGSRLKIFFLATVLLVVADQITKQLALLYLAAGPLTLLPFLSLHLACNTGAAFSMLQGYSWLFSIVALFFSGYFCYRIWHLTRGAFLEGWSYTLILSGAVVNLLDRLTHGCVIDFVHFHYLSFGFPVFNLADTCITFGAAGWIVLMYRDYSRERT